jgi:hypothetical protein
VEGLEELGEVHGGRGDLVQRLLLDGHGAVTPPRRHGPRRPALHTRARAHPFVSSNNRVFFVSVKRAVRSE